MEAIRCGRVDRKAITLFVVAAVAEIGGAWLIWQGVREHRGLVWVGAGIVALAAYGFVATLQDDAHFGRILAAYGGMFVAGSLAWGVVPTGSARPLRPHRRGDLPGRCRRHHVRPTLRNGRILLTFRPGSNLYRDVVSTYTIGEVPTQRFQASALRYYEEIGLVDPARRSDSGYRLYDDRTLDRFAFIARAKQLGCSLEEITELVGMWDGERCGPVQRRLHQLMTDKIPAAESQVSELTTFTTQLRASAKQVGGEPVDGPCGAECACLHDPTDTATVTLVVKPPDPPIACALGAGELADRLIQWQQLLDSAMRRVALASGVIRAEFHDDVDVGRRSPPWCGPSACSTRSSASPSPSTSEVSAWRSTPRRAPPTS